MCIDDVQQTVHVLRAMYRMDEIMGDFAEFVTVRSMTDSQGLVNMVMYVCTALHIMIRTPIQGPASKDGVMPLSALSAPERNGCSPELLLVVPMMGKRCSRVPSGCEGWWWVRKSLPLESDM